MCKIIKSILLSSVVTVISAPTLTFAHEITPSQSNNTATVVADITCPDTPSLPDGLPPESAVGGVECLPDFPSWG